MLFIIMQVTIKAYPCCLSLHWIITTGLKRLKILTKRFLLKLLILLSFTLWITTRGKILKLHNLHIPHKLFFWKVHHYYSIWVFGSATVVDGEIWKMNKCQVSFNREMEGAAATEEKKSEVAWSSPKHREERVWKVKVAWLWISY